MENIRHLNDIKKQALIEFKKALLKRFPNRIKKIILYGSYARGDTNPDSDIDILIIVDNSDWEFIEQIGEISWEIQFKYDFKIFISEMIYTQADFKKDKNHLFVRNVQHDGIEL